MNLFLIDNQLGWRTDELSKAKAQTGEFRGGKYAARTQIGYNDDGSPKYRYFATQEEYESYLSGKRKKKKKKKDEDSEKDEDKDKEEKKEDREADKKQKQLLGKDKKVTKSFRLYLEV